MSYSRKRIDLTITLGSGQFGADVGDTVTISGARTFVEATNPGGDTMGAASVRVYGLTQELMNKLTTIGQINRAIRIKNTVSIAAGDDNGMQLVFFGVIVDAWGDYNSAPDVPFVIMAQAGLDIAVKPVTASAYKGSVDVAQIMADLATEAGLALEPNGVSVMLSNPYLPGTTLTKIRAAARAAKIEYVIDRGTLALWGGPISREGDAPLISSATGMIGYPTLSSKGLTIRSVFGLPISLGAPVQIESSLPMANGVWRVYNLSHSLSAEVPDGPWTTTTEAYRVE